MWLQTRLVPNLPVMDNRVFLLHELILRILYPCRLDKLDQECIAYHRRPGCHSIPRLIHRHPL